MPSETAAERHAMEKRARAILRRYRACLKVTATAKAIAPTAVPNDHAFAAGTESARQEWMFDIHNALKQCGSNGAKVLVYRCLAQQKSQHAAFRDVGARVGLAAFDAHVVFCIALRLFLAHLDKYGIPDDYIETRPVEGILEEMRCAARDLESPCAMTA